MLRALAFCRVMCPINSPVRFVSFSFSFLLYVKGERGEWEWEGGERTFPGTSYTSLRSGDSHTVVVPCL